MFKSIIGSIAGAAVGLGIHYGIKESTGDTYIWFPVVIGVLTGLLARMVSDKDAGNASRYVAGFFAAVISLLAIFGIDYVDALAKTKDTDFGPLPSRISQKADDGEDQDSVDQSDDATADSAADDSTETEGSDSTETASGDSSDAGDPEGGAEDKSDDAVASDRSERSTPPVDSFDRRSSDEPVDPAAVEKAKERFAELIGKKAHESWYDVYLPYIFSAVGALMAYQLARGFGSAPVKE